MRTEMALLSDPDGSKSFLASLLGGAGIAAEGAAAAEAALAVEKATGSTSDTLTELASRAVSTIGPGSGAVYGTQVHSAFEDAIMALNDPALQTEVSYLNGQIVPRGTAGSVRLDVVQYDSSGKIAAIYDLKTGSATLTASRIQQVQANIPGGTNIPVLEIKP